MGFPTPFAYSVSKCARGIYGFLRQELMGTGLHVMWGLSRFIVTPMTAPLRRPLAPLTPANLPNHGRGDLKGLAARHTRRSIIPGMSSWP